MAGHSKWANIKHRKGAQDAKRGRLFTKLIREITMSAKQGADPDANPRLRAAILAARTQNLAKDTIDKAIKRGVGGLDGVNYDEVRYEGYGPGGVAVIVDCLTDNRNRTVGEVRYLFSRHGGNLGTDGCVAFMFDRKGELVYEGVDENLLMEAALEAGAEDVVASGGGFEVVTDPDQFIQVQEALARVGFDRPVAAEMVMRPRITTVITEERQAESLLKLLDGLEDNDDVQRVSANYDIPDAVLEKLGGA